MVVVSNDLLTELVGNDNKLTFNHVEMHLVETVAFYTALLDKVG